MNSSVNSLAIDALVQVVDYIATTDGMIRQQAAGPIQVLVALLMVWTLFVSVCATMHYTILVVRTVVSTVRHVLNAVCFRLFGLLDRYTVYALHKGRLYKLPPSSLAVGIVMEGAVSGSYASKMPMPDFQVQLFGWRPDLKKWVYIGGAFRVGNRTQDFIMTVGHNIVGFGDEMKIVNNKGQEAILPLKDVITEPGFDAAMIPTPNFGPEFALKKASLGDHDCRQCATIVGPAGGVTGDLYDSETFGMLSFKATTMRGNSGCPYFVGNQVYGVHVGMYGEDNRGFSASYVFARLTTEEKRDSAYWGAKLTESLMGVKGSFRGQKRHDGSYIMYVRGTYRKFSKQQVGSIYIGKKGKDGDEFDYTETSDDMDYTPESNATAFFDDSESTSHVDSGNEVAPAGAQGNTPRKVFGVSSLSTLMDNATASLSVKPHASISTQRTGSSDGQGSTHVPSALVSPTISTLPSELGEILKNLSSTVATLSRKMDDLENQPTPAPRIAKPVSTKPNRTAFLSKFFGMPLTAFKDQQHAAEVKAGRMLLDWMASGEKEQSNELKSASDLALSFREKERAGLEAYAAL